jgi:hypothetical protein
MASEVDSGGKQVIARAAAVLKALEPDRQVIRSAAHHGSQDCHRAGGTANGAD